MLCAPPGAGKSTFCKQYPEHYRISQDDQGQKQHLSLFLNALAEGLDIIVDRLNFNKEQRNRYLEPAKKAGYTTKIVVLHEPKNLCLERMKTREGHPTIKNEENAKNALDLFFRKYERPTPNEADEIEFVYPEGKKPLAIWVDMDNTLSDASHRAHFLDKTKGKPNWNDFFEACKDDPINDWCVDLIRGMYKLDRKILICSARPIDYKNYTKNWLEQNNVPYHEIIMRNKNDFRPDYIVKEQMYDFEIKTKYELIFSVDDRKQVIDKMRSRGVIVLDCAGERGNF